MGRTCRPRSPLVHASELFRIPTPLLSPFRTATKLLRFAPDELTAITERAHRCGQTPARFIREAALGIIPHARRGTADDDLLRQLARIGNNLNQLAREANTEDRFPLESRIDAALHQILDVARRLRWPAMAVPRRTGLDEPPMIAKARSGPSSRIRKRSSP